MKDFIGRAFAYALVASILANIAVVFLQMVSGLVLSLQEMVGGSEKLMVAVVAVAIIGGITYAGVQTWRENY